MSYEQIKRSKYLEKGSQDHDNRHHFIDFENFVIPLECMHNSNLHDCGIARGLEVSSTEDKTKIIINPGVAIENISGQLISLSSKGHGAIDDPNSADGSQKTGTVPVPVFLSTQKNAGQIVYITIESLDSSSSSLGNITIVEQTPWIRLQRVADYEKSPIAVTRSKAKFSSASSNLVTVTPAEDAAKFKIGDYVLLVQERKSERVKISKIIGANVTFETNLHNTYTEGTIRIADLIPQQKDIRLNDITNIKKDTCIIITQNNMAEVRIVESLNASNKSITLKEGLVNTYTMEDFDAAVNIQIVDKSIVLAIALIDNYGKIEQLVGNPSELKGVTNLPKYHRHLIGEKIGELRIKRPIKIGDNVQDVLSCKIGPGDGGGLKITVPDANDSILFAKEGGGDFKSLEINANVGIGTQGQSANLVVNGDVNGKANLIIDGKVGIGNISPSDELHVIGTVSATEFKGKGYAVTNLNGENITDGIINDARISNNITRIGHKHTGEETDGPKISHGNLVESLEVNTTSTDNLKNKHVSDELAKGWQDHITTKSGNPHGTTADDVKALPICGGNITGKVTIETASIQPQLCLSGGNSDLTTSEGDLKIGDDSYSLKIGVAKSGAEAGDAHIRAVGGTNRLMLGVDDDDTLTIVRREVEAGKYQKQVGIGTINPSAKLEVNGDIKANGDLVIAGNVGIGTKDSQGKLDVFGDAYFGTGKKYENHKIIIRGPDEPADINGHQDLSYEFSGAVSSKIRAYQGGDWDTYLQFLTNLKGSKKDDPQVRMHIDQNGNVGIGTTRPKTCLDVRGKKPENSTDYEGIITIGPPEGETAAIYKRYDGKNTYLGIESYNVRNTVKTPIVLQEYGGDVGIGTTSPTAKLEVNGDIKGNANLIINGNACIKTDNPQFGLDINASNIKLGLEKKGGGRLVITNNEPNDDAVYLQAWSSKSDSSAPKFVLSGYNDHNIPNLSLKADNTIFTGNVGIGVPVPEQSLAVKGNIKCDNVYAENLYGKGSEIHGLNTGQLTDYLAKKEVITFYFESGDGKNEFKKSIDFEPKIVFLHGAAHFQLKDVLISYGYPIFGFWSPETKSFTPHIVIKFRDQQAHAYPVISQRSESEIFWFMLDSVSLHSVRMDYITHGYIIGSLTFSQDRTIRLRLETISSEYFDYSICGMMTCIG